MKKIQILSIVILTFIIGLFAGKFFFGKKQEVMEDHSMHVETQTNAAEEIWTCSMHPQIRQNEPGLCPICEMDLIPLDSQSSDDPLVLKMSEAAVELAQIQTAVVGASDKAKTSSLILSGRIKPDERRISSQVSHFPGRIEKLYVSYKGEEVQKGQKIAELYSPELITAQAELLEAASLGLDSSYIEAARKKLLYWKIPMETILQIESSGQVQENFPLYASGSGIVSKRKVAIGDYVKKGDVLFELVNLNRLWLVFDAYEKDLEKLKLGQSISFTTRAYPDRTFESKISYIDPLIDPDTRVAQVRAEVNNSSGLLKPEMFIEGKVQAKVKNNNEALSVPKSAVLWTGKRSVVYIKLPDSEVPSFQYQEVELGKSLGDKFEILEGLNPGDEIVVHGSFVIDASAQLNNQTSMMNNSVSVKKEQTGIPDFSSLASSELTKKIQELTSNYLALKNALVASDNQNAITEAQNWLSSLQDIKTEGLKDEALEFMNQQLDLMNNHGEILINSVDVEDQRKQFSFISKAQVDLIKAFGISSGKYYLQYCPMALNNTGAEWLSGEEEIRNPYFGDKMLKCGVLKDILQKK